ncbi:MAG: hypothetical protein K8S13_12400 [Desulfobacula sp.]|uniref:hypothetical protein n=1 Tax=Desulfobacula sp. TaxID=2593537 RepID=UPI0025C5ED83|nr:hypothetical protein [Desulfobacula sp.]MCD4720638.1 hypothetical protein [Desulfobacula sp.]
MAYCRKKLYILFCLSILLSATFSYAEEEIEDLIDIFEADSKIIAIIEGKKTIPFNLQSKENVLWSASKGNLGAFLTNDHFFIISTSSGVWKYLHLRIDESEKAIASLSPYIALLVTNNRVIGYNTVSNQFIETQLSINDEFVTAKVEKYVAVVITSSKVIGFTTKTSTFISIPLRGKETLHTIKITSSKAIVRTSDRLLTFEAKGSIWNEHRL